MLAQRGGGYILAELFNLGIKSGCVVKAMPQQIYPRERNPIPIV
jgi:hypothetical protein